MKRERQSNNATNDRISVTGLIIMKTRKAILLDDGTIRAWLPKKLIGVKPLKNTGLVQVDMPEWLAKEKDFLG